MLGEETSADGPIHIYITMKVWLSWQSETRVYQLSNPFNHKHSYVCYHMQLSCGVILTVIYFIDPSRVATNSL